MIPTQSSPLRGILLKSLSVVVFTVMSSLVKATAGGALPIPPGQQMFFRSFFAIPVILVWLAMRGELGVGLRTHRPMGHFYRGLVGSAAMCMSFWALALLPLPEVTAIGYAAPLLTVILAAMFLGEPVRLFRLSMVALGLLGVVIVLSPRLGAGVTGDPRHSLGAVVTLTGAACTAMAMIFVRKLAQEERTSAIVFWFSVTSTLLGLLTLPFGWVMPDAGTLAMLVAIGLLGGVAQILLTSAYRYADASLIAPFDYVSMVLALLIGWFVFAEAPTGAMLAGAALVILAGILIIWRERQLGLERNRQRKAMTPQG
ncbi:MULTISPECIES: DMT family transporter [Paracoccus]|uniref:DMT family transporter n=2 Tax=Paracoccus TaxID=265 RepID=A0A386UGX8_9RHOB|nr:MULTISPECIES: DMT family transporter [Paracoccus]AWX93386.1 DMT family transporter [Paracoccus mutanolyticus]AYE99800.1 EamA/RhaT family transporter [Paracoccus yeei]MBY0135197.1 DMT family transporter [Paracoccus yeei]OWJ96786.1 EamA/RhaT family transporter [Paracoccus yeei]QEU07686.1 DMT family transporter [Paracoccus yeei]